MPVERSPTGEKSQEENRTQKIDYPTGKLASFTRKKNEIMEQIESDVADAEKVKPLLEELKLRIHNFDEASLPFLYKEPTNNEEQIQFNNWYKHHSDVMEQFRLYTDNWLQNYEEIQASDSVSQTKSTTNRSTLVGSTASQTSTIKLRLAQKKAQRLASQSVLIEERRLKDQQKQIEARRKEQQFQLEEAEEKIRRQQEDLEHKKSEVEEQNLLAEIEKLEVSRSRVGSRVSRMTESRRSLAYEDHHSFVQHPYFDEQPPPLANIFQTRWKNKESDPLLKSQNVLPPQEMNQLAEVLVRQSEISAMLLKSQEKANLPKHSPENFDGMDITKYKSFIQTFERLIEEKCDNDIDRLYYLEKFTSGLPLQLVKGCRNINSKQGYQDAKQALEKEFGNKYRVTSAYISKIYDWQPIKNDDQKALQELSIFLFSCNNMMNDVTPMCQLNGPTEIMKIVDKLPYKMREAWRRHTHALQTHGKDILFQDLCKFVQSQSDILNQPIFGKITDLREVRKDEPNRKSNPSHKKVYSTSVSNTRELAPSKACIVCKKTNHQIKTCFFFKAKNHEEKMKILRENKICYGCLASTTHMCRDCPNRSKCDICSEKHATVLHRPKEFRNKVDSGESLQSSSKTEDIGTKDTSKESKIACATKSITSGSHSGAGNKIMCPSIPVKVRIMGSNKTIITYMGLDPYCTDVFMSGNLLKELGLKGRECDVTMTTMQGKHMTTNTRVINNVEILDLDENERSVVPVVYCTTKDWPFEKGDSPNPNDLKNLSYLIDLPFRFVDAEIGLLVGLNQPDILRPIKIINGPDQNGSYVTIHKHGYALNGPIVQSANHNLHCFRTRVEKTSYIDDKYKELCAREFQDQDPTTLNPSIEDKKWEAKVRSTMKKCEDGHYEVGLPFKEDDVYFPQNKHQVLSRLMSSKKKLKEKKDFYKEYKSFMDAMFINNFAEEIPLNELEVLPGKSWYLVHFGTYHKQKKKIRVVFDASLKYKGTSLNDKLMQGPDLTSSLLGVLLRFREERTAFMADIEKMYYQVRVPSHQRDYLRFLWFPDGDLEQTPKEYRVTVHIFGAVSSPSIANFTLRELTRSKEVQEFDEEVKQMVLRNFYVDDLVKSIHGDQKAIKALKDVCKLVACGGFRLTAIVSNSRTVLQSVPAQEFAKNLKDLDLELDPLPSERTLGVNWNTETDTIGFHLKLPEMKNTRRGVLSTVFSVYDPLGIASPVILPAKRIFQATCYEKMQWDDPLPPKLQESWDKWLNNIHYLTQFQIPRCFKQTDGDVVTTQIHLFCDGSESAYATVAYLRFTDKQERSYCSFVMSRTRLVPLKGAALSTIPRIELNGAKLAVQLYLTLMKELDLKIENSFFWTDSTTVLKYINSESRRFQRFVCNRVTFIREHSRIDNWRHVPTGVNPADLASRGALASVFVKDKQWLYGPEFLQKPQIDWPSMEVSIPLPENDPELKKEKLVLSTRMEDSRIMDILFESLSNWHKTLKRISWFLRLKQGLKSGVWLKDDLHPDELRTAEKSIWIYLQSRIYSMELHQLKTKGVLSKKNKLIKLKPFIDDEGLLRVEGRISRAKSSYDTKHPIILPKDHHLVRLLVMKTHVQVGHLGRESTLAALRRSYWIVGVNTLVRQMIKGCVMCRKRQGKPLQQLMGDLPEDRILANLPPFTNTGLDCFGPFLVTRGRTQVKRYGVIFTCLSSRAIHIEIVFSLECDSFINALRRFAARRGLPKLIRSDNGTNFVAAEKELRKSLDAFNSTPMKEWLLQHAIDWKFQPPATSHFGGVWEREIRSIRKVLAALMNEQPMRMRDDGFSTLMCEVESILNTRPLTAVSDDPDDYEALTPNHLLLARSEVTFPPGLFSKDDAYVKRRWRQVQYLAELFWTRWRKEYLPLLQERQKWLTEEKSCEVDDLVLVTDHLLPRNQWSLGRIARTYPDNHGRVRVADVRIAKVKGELKPGNRTTIIRRPITKLIILRSSN